MRTPSKLKVVCCKCGNELTDICEGYAYKCRICEYTVAIVPIEEPKPSEEPQPR